MRGKRPVRRDDGKVYPSIIAAARDLAIGRKEAVSLASQIGAVASHRGYHKTAGGYAWEYVDESVGEEMGV